MPSIRLWLDDERDPATFAEGAGWTWAKTADEAIDLLKTGRVSCASLDHDLSDKAAACAATGQALPRGERTGYTVACWMERHDVWPPFGVGCHSANPVGKERILAVVRRQYGPVRFDFTRGGAGKVRPWWTAAKPARWREEYLGHWPEDGLG